MSDPVVLALAADARYALPLAVTLRSALTHLEPDRALATFIVDDGLPPERRELIEASADDPRCSITWVPAPRSAFAGLPCWGRMPATPYSRLLLADLLPASIRRVLWLDCDLLVLGDLAELWRTPLDATIGAVRDPIIPRLGSRFGLRGVPELGLPEDAPYFNSGVMLIDLDGWRGSDVQGRTLEFLRRYRDRVFFQDQAALNAVLSRSWTELDTRWNTAVSDSLVSRGMHGSEAGRGILHFSGSMKPWRFRGRGPVYRLYVQYIDRTAWAGWRPPASFSGALLSLYGGSGARRWLHPLEQRLFGLYMTLTRRYANANGS